MHKDVQQGQFTFLVDKALSAGAVDAKVIPSGKVFVEDRVRLKCRIGDSKRILLAMLELEKTAFNAGYTFAVAFTNGSCRLCEKCNLENGICLHPNMARIPEHAVGINMKKTAAEAGMPIAFPIGPTPEPMAILLID